MKNLYTGFSAPSFFSTATLISKVSGPIRQIGGKLLFLSIPDKSHTWKESFVSFSIFPGPVFQEAMVILPDGTKKQGFINIEP